MRLHRIWQIGLPVLMGLVATDTAHAQDTYRLDGRKMVGGVAVAAEWETSNPLADPNAKDADTELVFHKRYYGGYYGGYRPVYPAYRPYYGGFYSYRPVYPRYYPNYSFSYGYYRPAPLPYYRPYYGNSFGFGVRFYGISDCVEAETPTQTLGYQPQDALASSQPLTQQPPLAQPHAQPQPVPYQPLPPSVSERSQALPTPRTLPPSNAQGYPYDGGPTNPVPMPAPDAQSPQPNPTRSRPMPQPINPADGRLVSLTPNTAKPKLRYPAYGESIAKPQPIAPAPQTLPAVDTQPNRMTGGLLNVSYTRPAR
ncbi:hypothetical protein [Tuwongella immobilis]|uniref:Uncharacterized protein n=1 Tax=Tuwongella immobilis TaxID=692036 RepID=A0A6C2YK32_9BACT|nr:hypothetical protein [Tuwongella immobilis]VIP01940.1 unnamed protein product [Tuwongella immobilis]VTR99908.1 unnamed protein product [Tuwongella immobilis]